MTARTVQHVNDNQKTRSKFRPAGTTIALLSVKQPHNPGFIIFIRAAHNATQQTNTTVTLIPIK